RRHGRHRHRRPCPRPHRNPNRSPRFRNPTRGCPIPRHGGRQRRGDRSMDHSTAPLLASVADYHAANRYGFTPPGHRQGRGIDDRALRARGADAFPRDILMAPGPDRRLARQGLLAEAEDLMADAVGADAAFFSTCGSSLSVKAAMMAVAGHDGGLLVARDSHKSIVAGLIFSGVQPYWITPRWDAERHFSH